MYGESLWMCGTALVVLSVFGAGLYFTHWSARSRRFRNRLRETYGEECCVRLRDSGVHTEVVEKTEEGVETP